MRNYDVENTQRNSCILRKRNLKKKKIGLVKVRWWHDFDLNVTWVPEDEFKRNAPTYFEVIPRMESY